MADLTGRTVLVTGGGGGLARATCDRFVECGARLAIADVDRDAAQETTQTARDRGGAAIAYKLDVTDPDAVHEWVDKVCNDLGGPSVLVNFAGGSLNTPRDLADISPDDFDLVVDVNLRGTFLCCQAVVPKMADEGGGSIVNLSSIGGRTTTPVTGVPYAAAKAGLLGLTRRLAREVGPFGIRVNAVAPGLFLSGARLQGMWTALDDDEQQEVLDAIALRRMPELREVADPIVFLASDDSSYITGAVLDVNGGRFMAP